jgi:HD superfamily phosphohydrolase YqeK
MKYYVTTTDKFMSGWGLAKGKINKLIFECEDFKQAAIVSDNAKCRSDQKHVNICSNKPYYNSTRYYVQYKTIKDYPAWYKKDYFRNQ